MSHVSKSSLVLSRKGDLRTRTLHSVLRGVHARSKEDPRSDALVLRAIMDAQAAGIVKEIDCMRSKGEDTLVISHLG